MKKSVFQFKMPHLCKLNFEVNQNFVKSQDTVQMRNNFHININRSKKENKAQVVLRYCVNKASDNVPFVLEADIASSFFWEEDLDEKKIDSFLKCNAPALLLSYLRPIVSSVVFNAGLPPFYIPFMNFRA